MPTKRPYGRFPVTGQDFQVVLPEGPVMQDELERIAWWNLTPEQRYLEASRNWRIWHELQSRSTDLAVRSLRNRFGDA